MPTHYRCLARILRRVATLVPKIQPFIDVLSDHVVVRCSKYR